MYVYFIFPCDYVFTKVNLVYYIEHLLDYFMNKITT